MNLYNLFSYNDIFNKFIDDLLFQNDFFTIYTIKKINKEFENLFYNHLDDYINNKYLDIYVNILSKNRPYIFINNCFILSDKNDINYFHEEIGRFNTPIRVKHFDQKIISLSLTYYYL